MADDGRYGYVVDDEAALRRSLALLLGAAGFEVATFESGEAFLEAADAGLPVGCVLLERPCEPRWGELVEPDRVRAAVEELH